VNKRILGTFALQRDIYLHARETDTLRRFLSSYRTQGFVPVQQFWFENTYYVVLERRGPTQREIDAVMDALART
jgi:hypothetical protein